MSSGERRYSDRVIYRRVLGEARPYWGHIVAIFLLTLLATPVALLAPVPLKIAVDSVLGDEPLPSFLGTILPQSVEESTTGLLIFTVLLLGAIKLLSELQTLSTRLLRAYTSERLALRFRSKLFRHAQRLSMTYHDRRGSADANYRIQRDAEAIPSVAVSGVIPFVSSAVMFAAMLVVIARIEPTLALIALVVAPVMAVLMWSYRRRLRMRHREVKALESSALGVVQEVLASLRVVKAFGQEEREEERFTRRAAEGMQARLRVTLVDGSFWVAIGLVTALGTGLVLFVGVRSVESGAMTLGSLLLVLSYLGQLYSPLSTISGRVASLQSGFASAERAFTLLDEQQDVPERPDARPIGRARGEVELRDVSFGYLPGQPVLEHVSLHVEPGARVGIAGRTGSGKSTLVSLLTRFYDPSIGVVLLDGIDLRDYRLADLRDQFAIVLQDNVLFSTTIGENIAYGKPDATAAEIVAAARAADAHDFVSALPQGYDTDVGERGMTLSGGERQRIALARAFLKDAPILILDEPTSSVDVRTEGAILDAMVRLMEGRTTFLIAHRLSTLEGCDVRIDVEAGRVLGRGIDRQTAGCSVVDQQSNREPTAPDRTASTWPLYRALTHSQNDLVPNTSSGNASSTIPPGSTEADEARVGVGGGRSAALVPPKRMDSSAMLAGWVDHPPVLAWARLHGQKRLPDAVEVLKAGKPGKINAYRLCGLGPGGGGVIVKCASARTLEFERLIYQEVLPSLPFPSLHCYGFVEAGSAAWQFLVDAEQSSLIPAADRQRIAMALWMGELHISAAGVSAGPRLPDRGPSHYTADGGDARGGAGITVHVEPEGIRARADDPLLFAPELGLRVGPDTRIDVLEHSGKSSVYRVSWQEPQPSSCIVKCYRAADGRGERDFYRHLAPRLAVPTLRLYSSYEDKHGSIWLVLEDAGDVEPTVESAEARVLLTDWTVALHTAGASIAAASMPDAGPDRFARRLEEARTHLLWRLEHDELDGDDREVLVRCLDRCLQLASVWPVLERVCRCFPRTLVHGDLVEENLRLRDAGTGPELVALDWEKTGWGVPAVDLVRVDPDRYWAGAHGWLGGTRAEFDRLLVVGRIFRVLVHRWAEKSIGKADRAEGRLARLLTAVDGWSTT